jgi:hypothetical protein
MPHPASHHLIKSALSPQQKRMPDPPSMIAVQTVGGPGARSAALALVLLLALSRPQVSGGPAAAQTPSHRDPTAMTTVDNEGLGQNDDQDRATRKSTGQHTPAPTAAKQRSTIGAPSSQYVEDLGI